MNRRRKWGLALAASAPLVYLVGLFVTKVSLIMGVGMMGGSFSCALVIARIAWKPEFWDG